MVVGENIDVLPNAQPDGHDKISTSNKQPCPISKTKNKSDHSHQTTRQRQQTPEKLHQTTQYRGIILVLSEAKFNEH